MPMHASWEPIDKLVDLNAIELLLRILALSYEWNYSGSFSSRAETVRSALDVLSICCALPSIHDKFCVRMRLPDDASAAGINIILGAAEGEIVADSDVQKSALYVLVHCVCAPICKVNCLIYQLYFSPNSLFLLKCFHSDIIRATYGRISQEESPEQKFNRPYQPGVGECAFEQWYHCVITTDGSKTANHRCR